MKVLYIGLICCLFASFLGSDSKEDAALLMGADSLYHGDFSKSFDELIVLFEETKEPYYAKLAAQAAVGKGDLDGAFALANLYIELSGDTEDIMINKILADAYAQMGETQKAIEVLEKIYKVESTPQIGDILGNMYMLQNNPKKAQELFSSLYEQTRSVEFLKKIIILYAAQSQNQKALGLLSEHLLSFGCEESFCEESLKVYADLGGLDMAKSVFEKIYIKNPTIPNATNFMRVLVALKQYQEAQGIAMSFPFDKGLLLDLYVMQGDFEKARIQAKQIYQESNNPKFLALEAIYELGDMQQISKQNALQSASKLEQALKIRKKELADNKQKPTIQDAFFYNFCGYLMIDYDLDIQKGIQYVKEALLVEPYSIAYLDSIAWGYYKLGDCANATEYFYKIPSNKIANDNDMRAHARQIYGLCAKPESKIKEP